MRAREPALRDCIVPLSSQPCFVPFTGLRAPRRSAVCSCSGSFQVELVHYPFVQTRVAVPLFLLLQVHLAMPAAAQTRTIPATTPVWVKSTSAVRLRVGEAVHGELMYPVFASNQEVLPSGTEVDGTIAAMEVDHSHRVQARLRGDFTPFSHPVVMFQRGRLADGTTFTLPAGPATDGAPMLRLTPPPPRKGGFLRQEFDTGVGMVKDRVRLVTAPGKKDRLTGLLYSQLPYHPQRVEAGTVWTVETTDAFSVPEPVTAEERSKIAGDLHAEALAKEPGDARTWTVQAYLAETVSSASAKVGAPLRAVVAEPVIDKTTGEVAVPQGAVLEGEVTRAKPARRFGRSGELRFDFRQLSFPGKPEREQVQTALSGIDAVGGTNLALDHEGQVQRKPQDKLAVPILLFALAGRPLDRDRGDNAFGKDAVASNSLGVLGFIVGTAGGWRNVAAGIGYYGTAVAVWNRWIKRGTETTLRKDTRLVVQTTARRSTPMRSGGVR